MSDTLELITRWQSGDQQAAALLYDLHRDRTYRLAWSLLGNSEDAEEVAQDALTYALINVDRYKPELAKFSTWLHTITVSRARDKQRRKRFSLTSLTEWLEIGREPVSDEPEPRQISEQDYAQGEVWQAVERLTPQLREAVVLRYWYEHSYEEIADIMQTSVSAIKSRLFRARRLMAQAGTEMGVGATN